MPEGEVTLAVCRPVCPAMTHEARHGRFGAGQGAGTDEAGICKGGRGGLQNEGGQGKTLYMTDRLTDAVDTLGGTVTQETRHSRSVAEASCR